MREELAASRLRRGAKSEVALLDEELPSLPTWMRQSIPSSLLSGATKAEQMKTVLEVPQTREPEKND